jgi:hypothetical protein
MHCSLFKFTWVLNWPLLETAGPQYIRLFYVQYCSSSKNYPSARCASVANVCRGADIFGTKTVSHIL